MEQTAVVRIRLDDTGLPAAAQRSAQALAGVGKAGEVSARQAAAAMRQLPAQFTDVATSLASGQNPLLVLLQQGGQIKDSFGGIDPALRGITSAISPMAVGVGAVTAAVGGLALAQNQAAKEAFELQRAVTLNGSAAGLTTREMTRLARVLDSTAGTTQAKATRALIQVAEASGAASKDLGLLTQAAIQLERAGGPSIEETAKAFERLRKEPLQATRELGTQLGYLTPQLFDQVRALTEQGRTLEAASVAQRAYASAAQDAAGQLDRALSPLQRGWRSLKETVAEAWDAMVGIGRAPTVLERLGQINAQLERNQAGGTRRGSQPRPGLVALGQADLEAERAATNRSLLNDVESGAARAQAIELARQFATARESVTKWSKEGTSASEKLAAALKELREQVALIRSQGGIVSAADEARAEKAIREQFAGPALKKSAYDRPSLEEALAFEREVEERSKALAAFIDDQINAQAKRDDRRVQQAFDTNTRLMEANEAYLQQLRDENKRLGLDLIEDERTRGEALIRLEADIARRRLDARAAAGEISGAALTGSRQLIDEREHLQIRAFSRRMGDSLYDDTRGALADALRDTKDPVRAFVQGFGNLLYGRLVARMADALATAAVGKDGKGGYFSDVLRFLGGYASGSTGGGAAGGGIGESLGGAVPMATGTNYVPRNMMAFLHEGEAVVPKQYNPAANGKVAGPGAQQPSVVLNMQVQGDVGVKARRAMLGVAAQVQARMQRQAAI